MIKVSFIVFVCAILFSGCMAALPVTVPSQPTPFVDTSEMKQTALSPSPSVTKVTNTAAVPTNTAMPSPTEPPTGINMDTYQQLAITQNYQIALEQLVPNIGEDFSIDAVTFSPDGRYVAIGGCTGAFFRLCQSKDSITQSFLLVLDSITAEPVSIVPETETTFTGLAFSPDSKQLVFASLPFRIAIWDIPSQAIVKTIAQNEDVVSQIQIKVNPDGKQLAAVYGNSLLIYDIESGNLVKELPALRYKPHLPKYTADGTRLAVYAGNVSKIAIYDTVSWEVVAEIQTPEATMGADTVDFSSDGRWVVTAASTQRPEILVWDARSGEQVDFLGETFEMITSLVFSPDNQLLFVGGYEDEEHFGGLSVWDMQSLQRLGVLQSFDSFNYMVFDSKGESMLSRGYGQVVLWSMSDQTILESRSLVLDFYAALSSGDYQKAATYFQPLGFDLEGLQAGGFDTSDLPALLEGMCAQETGICLPVMQVLPGGGRSQFGEYDVFVQFQAPDESVFVDPNGFTAFTTIVGRNDEGDLKVSFIPTFE